MVGAAVVLLGVTGGIVLVIEGPVEALVAAHLLDHVAELGGEATGADELCVVGAATDFIAFLAAANHVEVDLRDDLLARHSRVIGEVLGAEEAEFFTGVPDENDGALGAGAFAGEGAGDFEDGHGAGAIVIGAVVDGVHARHRNGATNGIHVHLHRGVEIGGDAAAVSVLLVAEFDVEGAE